MESKNRLRVYGIRAVCELATDACMAIKDARARQPFQDLVLIRERVSGAVAQAEEECFGTSACAPLERRAADLAAGEKEPRAVAAFAAKCDAVADKFEGRVKDVLQRQASDATAVEWQARLRRRFDAVTFILGHVYVDVTPLTRPVEPSWLFASDAAAVQAAKADLDEVVRVLSGMLQREVISFPWKRMYMGRDGAVDGMMKRLRDFRAQTDNKSVTPHNVFFSARTKAGNELLPLKYKGDYLCFIHNETDYREMDVIVDMVQERARLVARRQDQDKSPMEQWHGSAQFVEQVLRGAMKRFHGRLDPESMREELFHAVRECTQFKPTLVKGVIEHFGARTMLDFSAGWGDRLAGAIGADVERYTAFDPNKTLIPGHAALIDRFVAPEKRSRFSITYVPFEQAVVEPDAYDLVFTSPPFFDFEVYTDLPGQSVQTYSTFETWLVHFLLTSMEKAWTALHVRGHMVIHITDVFKTKVCEPMCLLALAFLPGCKYLGVMNSNGLAGKPRPMWAFQRIPEDKRTQDAGTQALAELRRLFPDIAACLAAARPDGPGKRPLDDGGDDGGASKRARTT